MWPVKPSGPEFLFVGSFLITDSISLLVIKSVQIFYFFLLQFFPLALLLSVAQRWAFFFLLNRILELLI